MQFSLHECPRSLVHVFILLHDELHQCDFLILELEDEILHLRVLTGRIVQFLHVLLKGITLGEGIAPAERTVVASFRLLLLLRLGSFHCFLLAGDLGSQLLQQFGLGFEFVLLTCQLGLAIHQPRFCLLCS